MNKLLAEGLWFLNSLLAIAFVGVGAIAGYVLFAEHGGFTVIGAILGFLAATLVCGTLAVFLDMREELVTIRKGAADQSRMQADALSAISKQLGAIHLALAERPAPAPAPAPTAAASTPGYCLGCHKPRASNVLKCVYCGDTHPVSTDKPQAPLGWCPSCAQRRVIDSRSCVWCGIENPAVAAKPDVEVHA